MHTARVKGVVVHVLGLPSPGGHDSAAHSQTESRGGAYSIGIKEYKVLCKKCCIVRSIDADKSMGIVV